MKAGLTEAFKRTDMTKKQQRFSEEITEASPEKVPAYLASDHVWKEDEYGEIDVFGNNSSWHNGPLCTECGYSACWHCQSVPTKECKPLTKLTKDAENT